MNGRTGEKNGALSKEILSDARYPEVDVLHSWAVVLPKFSGETFYKTEDT